MNKNHKWTLLFTMLVGLSAAGCGGGSGSGEPKTVELSWAANREAAVNKEGGGYTVYYRRGFPPGTQTMHELDVPYASGSRAPTSVTLELKPGLYFVSVAAYSALTVDGKAARSQPSEEVPVVVK